MSSWNALYFEITQQVFFLTSSGARKSKMLWAKDQSQAIQTQHVNFFTPFSCICVYFSTNIAK